MPVTLNSTGISFSDGNSQNTAAEGGVPTSTTTTLINSSTNYSKPANAFGVLVAVGSGGGGGGTGNPRNRGGTNPNFPSNSTQIGALAFIPSAALPNSVPVSIGSGGNPSGGGGNAGGNSNFAGLVASNSDYSNEYLIMGVKVSTPSVTPALVNIAGAPGNGPTPGQPGKVRVRTLGD